MQVERYRIVLTGWVMTGRQTHEVITELSRLFKIPESRIRPLLVGEPSIIRRDLTLDKAERLRNKIEKRGAVCSLKRVMREEDDHRLKRDSFVHTEMLEPDLDMESTQFVLTEQLPRGSSRLSPGFFSHRDGYGKKKGPSRPVILLLAGSLLVAVLLALYYFLL